MRSHQFLYVEYEDGDREFYDLQTDPFELHNLAGELSAPTLAQLHQTLMAMANCHDGVSCWASMGGGQPDGLAIRIVKHRGDRGASGKRR
jgi:hypothetical protein